MTISLRDFHNDIKPVTNLWICGVGHPAGITYLHDVKSDDDSYCDVGAVIDDLDIWELTGTVSQSCWEWDGNGSPIDTRGNSILNIKAS